MARKLKNTWTAKGRKFDMQTHLPATGEDVDIMIFEESRSVHMDDGTRPYGQPIEARLAIHLMAEMLKKLEHDLGIGFLGESMFKNMRAGMQPNEETWLKNLLLASFGITFDKNVILKILSQPKCEGMRCYLCLKDIDGSIQTKDDLFLSLVLVGVDEDGYDLHYKSSKLRADTDLKTESLTSEYAHPPGSVTKFLGENLFALLRLAEDLIKNEEEH